MTVRNGNTSPGRACRIPTSPGIGLRPCHVADFLADDAPDIEWLEIHTETWLVPGGPRLRALELIRRDYPVSCHGVGLSLGSADGLDPEHLARVSGFCDRIEPGLVSDHLAWSVVDGIYLNDLLPLPYSTEALDVVCRNVDQAQSALRRPLLIENPSGYLEQPASVMSETDFLVALARRTGCFLLLDVNNLFVGAANLGHPPGDAIGALPPGMVAEIHVAGHTRCEIGDEIVLIDDHGAHVAEPVWDLLDVALSRFGPQPVLIEWDTDVPPVDVLLGEAARARAMLGGRAALPDVMYHAA